MSPAMLEVTNALMTVDNPVPNELKDYLIEIQYDIFDPHKIVKVWIHEASTGSTLIRIQSKKVESSK